MPFSPQDLSSLMGRSTTGIIVLVLLAVEALWSWARKAKVHGAGDTAFNVVVFLGRGVFAGFFAAYVLRALDLAYAHRVVTAPGGWVGFLLGFFLVDALYYLEHRALHTAKGLWFFHRIHHSSVHYNFTTSFRLHWLGPILTPVFFAPAVLLGFSPALVIGLHAVNLLFQFFLHTEMVGRIPFLEGVLNTPSAHRVHHASNPRYIDRNMGGMLMIWDRLGGTYEPEGERPIYGLVGTAKSAGLLARLRELPLLGRKNPVVSRA